MGTILNLKPTERVKRTELQETLDKYLPTLLEEALCEIEDILRKPTAKTSDKLAAAKLIVELAKTR